MDPERYVRLLLEDVLAEPVPGRSVTGALRALTGAGRLDPARAGALHADVTHALALRAGPDEGPNAEAYEEPGDQDLPFVVGMGPATIPLPGASLHVAAIISDGVDALLEGRLVLAGSDGGEAIAALAVTDDRGTAYRVAPAAGSHDDGFSGDLIPPPPDGCAWLELSGPDERPVRVTLARTPEGTRGAAPHHRSPAGQYLEGLVTNRLAQLLLDGEVHRDGDAGPAVDALVATGAVAPDDQAVTRALRADAAAVGLADGAPDPHTDAVLAARDRVGRRGVWSLLTRVSVVDGVRLRLDVLNAGATSMTVLGRCSPWPPPAPAPITISAVDDLGGRYVGSPDGTAGQGVIWSLVPALDPGASHLTVTLAGPRHAVDTVVELG